MKLWGPVAVVVLLLAGCKGSGPEVVKIDPTIILVPTHVAPCQIHSPTMTTIRISIMAKTSP